MRTTLLREASGWSAAILIAIITTAQIASTVRSDLLFRDGDSLVVALFARSIADGAPFDWVMSSVLFVPEIIVFGALWMLGGLLSLDVNTLLTLNAIVNLTALYGAIRFAAGRRTAGSAPVAWALIAMAVFCVVAVTETSGSRDALELASLLTTTTYYSATVIALVLTAGLVRRAFDRDAPAGRFPICLGVVAAVSVLSNPLYAAWAAAPLAVILAIAAVYPVARARALPLLWALLGGTIAGWIARIPLSAWIANDGSEYAQPGLWPESARYYGDLLGERLATPLGWAGTLIVVALMIASFVISLRSASIGARLLATAAWAVPLLVLVAMVVLGTHAARYLEPVVVVPVLGLVASPRVVRMPRRAAVWTSAAVSAALVVCAGLSVPRAAVASQHPNDDLVCVNDWVSASGRTGAGQFWTVRLPKLHIDDASQLVQVDHQLNAYAWLVNQSDFSVGEVTFLIEDAQSSPWELGTNVLPVDVIDCGQYTIYDFGTQTLPLGPPRN